MPSGKRNATLDAVLSKAPTLWGYSPGSSSRTIGTFNTDFYIAFASAGYRTNVISFPSPANGILRNLMVQSTNLHTTGIITGPVAAGTLTSAVQVARDCRTPAAFQDTNLVCTTSATANCCFNGACFVVHQGDRIAFRVRYNSAAGEMTPLFLQYLASVAFFTEDQLCSAALYTRVPNSTSSQRRGLSTSLIPFLNGGPNTIANNAIDPTTGTLINNPFFILQGGGNHGDELFQFVPECGFVRSLTIAASFYTDLLQLGEDLQVVVRKAPRCCNAPFSDTSLRCNLTSCALSAATAQSPVVLCCGTRPDTVLPVEAGDKIAIRVTFAALAGIGSIRRNIIIGGGLEYLRCSPAPAPAQEVRSVSSSTTDEPSSSSAPSAAHPQKLNSTIFRYATSTPTALIANTPGTLEFAGGFSYQSDQKFPVPVPVVKYYVAAADGFLQRLTANFSFASSVTTLSGSLIVTVLVARDCCQPFSATPLQCALTDQVACCCAQADIGNKRARRCVKIRRGDRIAVQIFWQTTTVTSAATALAASFSNSDEGSSGANRSPSSAFLLQAPAPIPTVLFGAAIEIVTRNALV